MSNRKTSRKSRKKPRKSAAGNFKETRLEARAKRELAKITRALDAVPAASEPFRRKAQSAEIFPYHAIASASPVPDLILDLIKGRDPDNQWIAVERALLSLGDAGDGHAMFMAMYREAAFQIGVEYALRSFPNWCPLVRFLPAEAREGIAVIVRRVAKNNLDAKDGE